MNTPTEKCSCIVMTVDRRPFQSIQLAGTICQCLEHRTNDAVHFSEDGRLLVYEYKGSFFIVRTSDGSLFKRCKGGLSKRISIVFVSRSYLVILDDDIMCVINVQTDEIEHRIPLFFLSVLRMHQCLLLPEEDGKSFNLIRCYHNPRSHSCEVSRLVFHNLTRRAQRAKNVVTSNCFFALNSNFQLLGSLK